MKVVIRYPSGRADCATVCTGRSVVGSSEDCDIVISDPSVGRRHLLFSLDDDGLEVEKVSDADAVWLNQDLLSERMPFAVGDSLRVGDVVISVRSASASIPDRTKSPDGTRKIRESVIRDLRSGWLGYRRIMEKLSSFISKEEARIASKCYASGRRIFLVALAVAFVGGFASASLEFAQWYRTSAVVSLLLDFLSNAVILFLAGRYRMSFAGRILWPLLLLSNSSSGLSPDSSFGGYWDVCYWVVLCVVGFGFMLGWLVDYGAGFVFEKTRLKKSQRLAALFLMVCLYVGLCCFAEELDSPQPIPWCVSALGVVPCLAWAFAGSRIVSVWDRVPADALFVAEIASQRSWRRVLCQVLSLVLLVIPTICVLSTLGEDERRQWPRDDSDVLWTDAETKDEAWFWEDRGRYFRPSDFDSNKIFQLPLSVLETPATSNEWKSAFSRYENDKDSDTTSLTNCLYELADEILLRKARKFASEHPDVPDEESPEREQLNRDLVRNCMNFVLSDLATNVCGLVAAISANANETQAYANLCELLSGYRVVSSNCTACAKDLGGNSICVACDSFELRPRFGKAASSVCMAKFGIGINARTRESVDKEQEERSRCKTGILLVIVLATLGVMILSRRGADSVVGFWLGLALLVNAAVVAERAAGFSSGIPGYMQFAIWRGAFSNPLYSLLAGCLSAVKSAKDIFFGLGTLAQSVLFVILCWPMVKSCGKWKRRWIFVGKAASAFGVACLVGAVTGVPCSDLGALADAFVRTAVILTLGIWGWALRRKRRQFTEIPQLGFLFFMGWLVSEVALLTFMGWTGNSLLGEPGGWGLFSKTWVPLFGMCELGLLICGGLPVVALACWILLFVRQKFLNILSLGGIMVILAAFAMPVALQLFDISDYVIGVTDNVFVSKSGMRIIVAVVLVAVVPRVFRMLRKIGRRVFMHDVYRMEQDVAVAIEKIFDESADKAASVRKVLSCVKISSFVFYERVSRDEFLRISSSGWTTRVPETLAMSAQLRLLLGIRRELVDFNKLPYSPEWFFESFELWRLHLQTNGALMLPICLGTSVRGLLFVSARDVVDMPTDRSLVGSINSFGLTSMTPR